MDPEQGQDNERPAFQGRRERTRRKLRDESSRRNNRQEGQEEPVEKSPEDDIKEIMDEAEKLFNARKNRKQIIEEQRRLYTTAYTVSNKKILN